MKRGWLYIVLIVAVIAVVSWWKSQQPQAVIDVIQPTTGDLRAYVEEQAVTELPQDYLIAMPIAGRLQTITLREGDAVKAGQVVAQLDTEDLQARVDQAGHRVEQLTAQINEVKDNTLENNALIEVIATVKSFDQAIEASIEKVAAAEAVAQYMKDELDRVHKLRASDAAPDKELREREIEYRQATAEFRSDQLELAAMRTLQAVSYIGPKFITDYIHHKRFDIASYEQQRNEATTELAIAQRNLDRAKITTDIDGIVLERLQTRRQYLQAGAALLTIGQMKDLEVIADVLTQRATRIQAGDPVEVFGDAIIDGPIQGEVLRVYPAGFKKISSLGVEQQRVKVAIKLHERPDNLQVGYRVQVRIYYDEVKDALQLPRTAMFRDRNGQYQVLVVREGITALQPVELGLMNERSAVIVKGLSESDHVVARPSKDIVPNMRVKAKTP